MVSEFPLPRSSDYGLNVAFAWKIQSLWGKEEKGKSPGQSPDKLGKSRKNRESPKKDKKEQIKIKK